MRRILLLVLMFLLIIMPCTFAAEGMVYENHQYNFSMNIPSGWGITTPKGPIVEIKLANHYAVFAVFAQSMNGHKLNSGIITQEIEDQSLTPYVKGTLKDHPTLVLKYKRHLRIGNHDAIQVLLKDDTSYLTAYFFFSKTACFLVPATGLSIHLDADLKTLNQIMSTVKFIN